MQHGDSVGHPFPVVVLFKVHEVTVLGAQALVLFGAILTVFAEKLKTV
jgi:hypothetical protein|tara:strand:+ start:108 stop:251 length:144 start_codon:yes stop_codon:yes gene_type:complete